MKNTSAADRTMWTIEITHFLGRTHKANWENLNTARKSFNLFLFLDFLTLPSHYDEKIERVKVWRREAV